MRFERLMIDIEGRLCRRLMLWFVLLWVGVIFIVFKNRFNN